MQRILFIGFVWPEPAATAAGAHITSLLDLFAANGWDITFASPAARTEKTAALAQRGIHCADITLNHHSFDAFIQQLQPQVVVFDRFMIEEQFGWRVEQHCPDALRILDTEDLACLRQARRDAFRQRGEINPSLEPAVLFTELAQREIASILRCDLSLIVSEFEERLLIERFRIEPAVLHYHPLCYASRAAAQPTPDFAARQGFVVIGNFRHAPNWDAVRWLNEAIWPRIRDAMPRAECRIYGAYTPPKASALHRPEQGFHVMGWAADARTVLREARVNLAPVRFGAGLKGKVVEALACGTPCVTTSIGAEGVAGELPFGGAVDDSAEQIASQAVILHENREHWQAARDKGYQIVRQRFRQEHHGGRLMARIQALQEQLPQHRLHNFTGAMLRHHRHKSTQYMAQWIEAKNRS